MRRLRPGRLLLSLPAIFGMVWTIVAGIAGCSGIGSVPDSGRADEAYIELDVEPETADVYIDGEYRGSADGWHRQMVPVEPGLRRLELRAEGYVSQRFDVDIDEGRTMTVRVRLQPSISTPDGGESRDNSQGDDPEVAPPEHPTTAE